MSGRNDNKRVPDEGAVAFTALERAGISPEAVERDPDAIKRLVDVGNATIHVVSELWFRDVGARPTIGGKLTEQESDAARVFDSFVAALRSLDLEAKG